ncbi:MAG: hypothetical protein ACBZ72_11980 [Candidatus Bathyarchaeia archaeon]|jgi:hypothetical protein
MKKVATRQKCELMQPSTLAVDSKIKYVSMMMFEEAGKTILQPLVTNQEAQRIKKLLHHKTLEVWLPNGQSDPEQFDVNILKYKQQMQPLTLCSKAKHRVCLKNHFDTIVSCEQCPLNTYGVDK